MPRQRMSTYLKRECPSRRCQDPLSESTSGRLVQIMMRPKALEVVVVGAGPAGLAAAQALPRGGTAVLEQGPHIGARDQSDPATNTEGVGGAGLYSDGKFSFEPSASALWSMEPSLIAPAREWAHAQLAAVGITPPSAPPAARRTTAHAEKSYPSVYGSVEAREELLARLLDGVKVQTGTRVEACALVDEGFELRTRTLRQEQMMHARSVVLASGRFGDGLGSDQVFRRLEFGVRIEQPSGLFFLKQHRALDPKLLVASKRCGVEFRTFCCCREGLIVETMTGGMLTLSGRADCAPSGRSNIGFNVRITDQEVAAELGPRLMEGLAAHRIVRSNLARFLASPRTTDLPSLLGPVAAACLHEGLTSLVEGFLGRDLEHAEIVGPTLEGVGMYPRHDQRFRIGAGMYVAGDISGSYRGLTAALVSGYAAGLALGKDLAL